MGLPLPAAAAKYPGCGADWAGNIIEGKVCPVACSDDFSAPIIGCVAFVSESTGAPMAFPQVLQKDASPGFGAPQ